MKHSFKFSLMETVFSHIFKYQLELDCLLLLLGLLNKLLQNITTLMGTLGQEIIYDILWMLISFHDVRALL